MSQIEVAYDIDDEELIEKLRSYEDAVRQAMAKRTEVGSVRWTTRQDDQGRLFLRLVEYSEPDNCLAEITPLDLNATPVEFEEMLSLNQRPCS